MDTEQQIQVLIMERHQQLTLPGEKRGPWTRLAEAMGGDGSDDSAAKQQIEAATNDIEREWNLDEDTRHLLREYVAEVAESVRVRDGAHPAAHKQGDEWHPAVYAMAVFHHLRVMSADPQSVERWATQMAEEREKCVREYAQCGCSTALGLKTFIAPFMKYGVVYLGDMAYVWHYLRRLMQWSAERGSPLLRLRHEMELTVRLFAHPALTARHVQKLLPALGRNYGPPPYAPHANAAALWEWMLAREPTGGRAMRECVADLQHSVWCVLADAVRSKDALLLANNAAAQRYIAACPVPAGALAAAWARARQFPRWSVPDHTEALVLVKQLMQLLTTRKIHVPDGFSTAFDVWNTRFRGQSVKMMAEYTRRLRMAATMTHAPYEVRWFVCDALGCSDVLDVKGVHLYLAWPLSWLHGDDVYGVVTRQLSESMEAAVRTAIDAAMTVPRDAARLDTAAGVPDVPQHPADRVLTDWQREADDDAVRERAVSLKQERERELQRTRSLREWPLTRLYLGNVADRQEALGAHARIRTRVHDMDTPGSRRAAITDLLAEIERNVQNWNMPTIDRRPALQERTDALIQAWQEADDDNKIRERTDAARAERDWELMRLPSERRWRATLQLLGGVTDRHEALFVLDAIKSRGGVQPFTVLDAISDKRYEAKAVQRRHAIAELLRELSVNEQNWDQVPLTTHLQGRSLDRIAESLIRGWTPSDTSGVTVIQGPHASLDEIVARLQQSGSALYNERREELQRPPGQRTWARTRQELGGLSSREDAKRVVQRLREHNSNRPPGGHTEEMAKLLAEAQENVLAWNRMTPSLTTGPPSSSPPHSQTTPAEMIEWKVTSDLAYADDVERYVARLHAERETQLRTHPDEKRVWLVTFGVLCIRDWKTAPMHLQLLLERLQQLDRQQPRRYANGTWYHRAADLFTALHDAVTENIRMRYAPQNAARPLHPAEIHELHEKYRVQRRPRRPLPEREKDPRPRPEAPRHNPGDNLVDVGHKRRRM